MRLAEVDCVSALEAVATDHGGSDTASVFRLFSAHNGWSRCQQLELLECYFGVDAVEIVLHYLEAAASPQEMWKFLEDVGGQPPAAARESWQPAIGAA